MFFCQIVGKGTYCTQDVAKLIRGIKPSPSSFLQDQKHFAMQTSLLSFLEFWPEMQIHTHICVNLYIYTHIYSFLLDFRRHWTLVITSTNTQKHFSWLKPHFQTRYGQLFCLFSLHQLKVFLKSQTWINCCMSPIISQTDTIVLLLVLTNNKTIKNKNNT